MTFKYVYDRIHGSFLCSGNRITISMMVTLTGLLFCQITDTQIYVLKMKTVTFDLVCAACRTQICRVRSGDNFRQSAYANPASVSAH